MSNITKKVRATLYGTAAVGLAMATFVPAALGATLGDSVESQFKETSEEIYGAQSADASLATIVGKVISGLLGLLGVILVVLMIYAGFLWMTAGGTQDKVTKAQGIIKNAVIGMIIVFAAYAITGFVITTLSEATK